MINIMTMATCNARFSSVSIIKLNKNPLTDSPESFLPACTKISQEMS